MALVWSPWVGEELCVQAMMIASWISKRSLSSQMSVPTQRWQVTESTGVGSSEMSKRSIVGGVLCSGRDEVQKVARTLRTEWYMETVMVPVSEL